MLGLLISKRDASKDVMERSLTYYTLLEYKEGPPTEMGTEEEDMEELWQIAGTGAEAHLLRSRKHITIAQEGLKDFQRDRQLWTQLPRRMTEAQTGRTFQSAIVQEDHIEARSRTSKRSEDGPDSDFFPKWLNYTLSHSLGLF